MPTFTFKLEGVLRLRKRAEQQAQKVVADKAAAANVLRDQIQKLNDELVGSTKALRDNNLTGSVDVNYLASHRRYTQSVARHGSTLVQKLALAERELSAAKQELAEKAKLRRILEVLREKHETRWRAELIRRELIDADDAAARWASRISRDAAETAETETAMAVEGIGR